MDWKKAMVLPGWTEIVRRPVSRAALDGLSTPLLCECFKQIVRDTEARMRASGALDEHNRPTYIVT